VRLSVGEDCSFLCPRRGSPLSLSLPLSDAQQLSPDDFIESLNRHLLNESRLHLTSAARAKLSSEISQTKLHHGSLFIALFQSLHDLERQAAAITALLKRYPHFKTKCCAVRFCFFCKISSFHHGQTCVEWMREEQGGGTGGGLVIKYCPSCSVPTVRSEGCSSMTCLCGRAWTW
jgi:hypothetical protein